MRFRKVIAFITTVLLLFCTVGVNYTAAKPMRGTGTVSDPYQIATESQLYLINNDKRACYQLQNDIVLTADWVPIGEGTDGGATSFQGTFDGNGYKISNLTIDTNLYGYVGLFAYNNGIIKNVGVDIHIVSTVPSPSFAVNGGIVGENDGTVDNCFASGYISAVKNMGGIVGENYYSGLIENCFSTVSFAPNLTSAGVGGITGSNRGTITDCYATGFMSGNPYMDGGAVGSYYGGSITGTFYDKETTGCTDSGKGTGLTSAEMKTQASYTGWDFDSIWVINPEQNGGYPNLRIFLAEKQPSEAVRFLPVPTNLAWSQTMHGCAEFDPVPGKTLDYIITFYKNNEEIGHTEYLGPTERVSVDWFYLSAGSFGSGQYTFTVQALGDDQGEWLDSPVSEMSPVYNYIMPDVKLQTPTGLVWRSSTVTSWNEVPMASGYIVWFYVNGNRTEASGWNNDGGGAQTSLDYSWGMEDRPAAVYTFNVQAYSPDIEKYLISDTSSLSPENYYDPNAVHTVKLSGVVQSYNPNNPVTVQLMKNNTVVDTITIPSVAGSGQVTQPFSFSDVSPGTYTLTITKPAHTPYTINNIVVSDKDVDLTQDPRDQVKLIILLTGDVNGDGSINVNDLNEIWSSLNYGKTVGEAQNPLCDLDGNGVINVNDLNILWSAINYGKGAVVIN